MVAALEYPPKMAPLRGLVRLIEKRTGSELGAIRLLLWSPRAAVGSALLELMRARETGGIDRRALRLARLTASFTVVCPFCIGMNSRGWEKDLTAEELEVTQGLRAADELLTLTVRERLIVEFARRASSTPAELDDGLAERMRDQFTVKELVTLSATCAQVNYWSRLVLGLGEDPS